LFIKRRPRWGGLGWWRRLLRFSWRGFFRRVGIAELLDVVGIDIRQLDRIILQGRRFWEFEPPTAIGAYPVDDQRQDEESYKRGTIPRSKDRFK
jgi:hypothetical protein